MHRFPRVADILGALILLASGMLFSAFPALAQTECKHPEAWAMPGISLVGFNGPLFVSVLTSIASEPPPPEIADAKLVIAYIPPDNAPVRLRFFDAMACDLGVWTQIPAEVLHFVDQHMGTPA